MYVDDASNGFFEYAKNLTLEDLFPEGDSFENEKIDLDQDIMKMDLYGCHANLREYQRLYILESGKNQQNIVEDSIDMRKTYSNCSDVHAPLPLPGRKVGSFSNTGDTSTLFDVKVLQSKIVQLQKGFSLLKNGIKLFLEFQGVSESNVDKILKAAMFRFVDKNESVKKLDSSLESEIKIQITRFKLERERFETRRVTFEKAITARRNSDLMNLSAEDLLVKLDKEMAEFFHDSENNEPFYKINEVQRWRERMLGLEYANLSQPIEFNIENKKNSDLLVPVSTLDIDCPNSSMIPTPVKMFTPSKTQFTPKNRFEKNRYDELSPNSSPVVTQSYNEIVASSETSLISDRIKFDESHSFSFHQVDSNVSNLLQHLADESTDTLLAQAAWSLSDKNSISDMVNVFNVTRHPYSVHHYSYQSEFQSEPENEFHADTVVDNEDEYSMVFEPYEDTNDCLLEESKSDIGLFSSNLGATVRKHERSSSSPIMFRESLNLTEKLFDPPSKVLLENFKEKDSIFQNSGSEEKYEVPKRPNTTSLLKPNPSFLKNRHTRLSSEPIPHLLKTLRETEICNSSDESWKNIKNLNRANKKDPLYYDTPIKKTNKLTENSQFASEISEQERDRDIKIIKLLGVGAFGRVYLGKEADGSLVALKRLFLDDNSASLMRLLALEVNMLRRLSHPNIVRYLGLYRCKSEPELLNIALEYVDGGSLASLIKKPFPESFVAGIILQVLKGVSYLHTEKIIHRDLKPANLLISTSVGVDGVKDPCVPLVKISDFGTATRVCEAQTMKRSCVGTPWFLAPEVIQVEAYSYPADIWSIGCCVFNLIFGKRPYDDCNAMQALYKMVCEPHPPFPSDQSCSFSCQDFILKCWKRDWKERPTASELISHPFIVSNTT